MKNVGWIALAAVIAGVPAATAQAADEIPFQACKNVKIVKDEAERKALEAKGCLASIQVSTPGIGDNLKTSVEAAAIGSVLGDVAKKQYLPDLEKKKAYWSHLKDCFHNPSSSADCQKSVDAIKGAYGNFVGDLRQDLAKTSILGNGGKPSVNPELKAFKTGTRSFLPSDFPESVTGNLQASELVVANSNIEKQGGDRSKIEEAAKLDYNKHLLTGVVRDGLYLVSYLPKPSGADADGKPQWSNAEWEKTIDRLVKDADREKSITEKAVTKGTVSFPAFGTRDLLANWNKDDRDLMYYATLTPEMEKWLEKHPGDCGAAIAATKWMHSKEFEKTVYSMAGMAVGGAGLGGAFSKIGTAGKAVAAVTALGGGDVGIAVMVGDYKQSQYKAENSFKQLAKVGVKGVKGSEDEVDVIDKKDYEEAKIHADNWLSDNAKSMATGAALFGGGAALGKKAAPMAETLAKALVSKTKSAREGLARLMMSSREPEKLSVELEKLAASSPDYRANMRANLISTEVQYSGMLSKEVKGTLSQMEKDGTLVLDDVGDVENTLLQAQPSVAQRLKLEGKCKAEGECYLAAAKEEAKALDEAKNACTKPAK